MLLTPLLLVASFSGVGLVSSDAKDPYIVEIEEWRAQRLEKLIAPAGWISLVGLDWLKPGASSIGSADDNDIVIASAPEHLGKVDWSDGAVTVTLNAGSGATIDGKAVASATMRDDSHENPTTIAFGTTHFYLIDRAGGKKGLRIKDSESDTRKHFQGLDYYPIDPSWRIEAKWVAFDPPRTIEIPNVTGAMDKFAVPGKAMFEHDGKSLELLPVLETDDATELFFIFSDKTSGKETYGAGRGFYSAMPKDGKVVLDFNKAYNPPCAFTPFSTCPLTPPENRLKFPVTAGEKKYRGSSH